MAVFVIDVFSFCYYPTRLAVWFFPVVDVTRRKNSPSIFCWMTFDLSMTKTATRMGLWEENYCKYLKKNIYYFLLLFIHDFLQAEHICLDITCLSTCLCAGSHCCFKTKQLCKCTWCIKLLLIWYIWFTTAHIAPPPPDIRQKKMSSVTYIRDAEYQHLYCDKQITIILIICKLTSVIHIKLM